MLINTITKLCTSLRTAYQPAYAILSNSSMHTIAQQATTTTHSSLGSIAGGAWSLLPIRTKVRDNFPRPKETKRIKVHGWVKRMSTLSGRRTIMRRILKGCHVLSH